MNKCKGCGKWWREDDRRMLAPDAAPFPLSAAMARKCKSSGKSVLTCCSGQVGDHCRKCNREHGC